MKDPSQPRALHQYHMTVRSKVLCFFLTFMILSQQCDASLHSRASSLQNLEDEFGLRLGIGEREWILQRQQTEEDGFCGMQLSETKGISMHPLQEIA